MSVKKYTCLAIKAYTNETILKSIGVVNTEDMFGTIVGEVREEEAYWFSMSTTGATLATSATNGVFDVGTTFFDVNSNFQSHPFDIVQGGGRSILLHFSNGYSIIIGPTAARYIPYPGFDFTINYNATTNCIYGLTTGSIHYFDNINGRTVYYVGVPVIHREFFSSPVNEYRFGFHPYQSHISGAYLWVYPAIPSNPNFFMYDSNDLENNLSRVQVVKRNSDFLNRFWRDIDASPFKYCCQMTVGEGGNTNPSYFFGSTNEPRMFTVTPDEHHAIHSVTAYNTMTNQQIPLQESGMDLLTGAKNYMFTMPAANVRIIVEFRSIEITIPVTVKYTSPRGKVFTTSFNLLYDDTEQREETAPPVEEGDSNI